MPILNKRLLLAAEMLGSKNSVADIGTDHAFLPIHIINKGLAKKVIASDIAEGPLSVARSNIKKYGLSDKIELRLASGLDKIKEKECDAVTILGMGGETIAEIIDRAKWLKSSEVTLILQPMTCDDRLRDYLYQNGFEIEAEQGVEDKGKLYTVMRVSFSGKITERQPYEKYIGKLLIEPNPSALSFVKKRLKSMEKCINEIENVEIRRNLFLELTKATSKIKKILENF